MMTINNINFIFFLPIISLTLTILFYYFFEKIKSIVNIYDISETEKRKIHSGNIPPIGGITFYLIFIIYFLFNLFFKLEDNFFNSNKDLVVIMFTASAIFFIGLIDDKFTISPVNKSFLFIITVTILILNSPELQIYFIRFTTLKTTYNLGDFTIFFTIFCVFCFMNAFNMYDGINLQSGLYIFLFFSVFFMKDIDSLFFICLFIPLIFFLYKNYKNKIFLGNCGSYFLSYLISIYLIRSNIVYSKISVEEILILLLVPGLDMLRLFMIRFAKGKNPFLPDNNHIHHLLLEKYSKLNVSLTIILITIIPYLIFTLIFESIIVLFLQSVLYFTIISIVRIKIR